MQDEGRMVTASMLSWHKILEKQTKISTESEKVMGVVRADMRTYDTLNSNKII